MISAQGFWHWLYNDGFLWLNRIHRPHPSKSDVIGSVGIAWAFGGLFGFLVLSFFRSFWFLPLAPIANITGYIVVSYAVYLESRVSETKRVTSGD